MLARYLLLPAFAVLPLAAAQPQPPTNVPAPATPSNDATYSCASTCAPPECVCASTSIPGGLTADKTPMFVTLTADDAIQDPTFNAFHQVLNATVNPNGCNLPF